MSNHRLALVPLEAWCYQAPEVKDRGRSVDIGLLAEALIYYDTVLANINTQPQFAELLRWFIEQNRFADLLGLLRDKTIGFYEYSFASSAVYHRDLGTYIVINIQDQLQSKPDSFMERFIEHPTVSSLLPDSHRLDALRKALDGGKVIEAKARDFGNAIDNARADYQDPRRNAVIIQAFLDDLFKLRAKGRAPRVEARVDEVVPNQRHTLHFNVDFARVAELGGPELNFHMGSPLAAGAVSNRLIWSGANLGCDLYVGRPMSLLIGDKLYESASSMKSGQIVENLKAEVEFPDIRKLVNAGKLALDDVLKIREKGVKFRAWLQDESDRDRNAIIAYHHEVAKELGIVNLGRSALSIFGVLGGGAVGAAVGGAVGGAAGGATRYLTDIISKLGANWKPVVFGDWVRERIETIIDSS